MNIRVCKTESDRSRWEAFVESQAAATKFHRWNWSRVIQNTFGWPPFNLLAMDGETVKGVLPLAWKKSKLFGSFVASLPSVSGGGVLAADQDTELALIEEAKRLTCELKADYLELRHREDHGLNLSSTTERVTVTLPIEKDVESQWNRLKSHLRTKIRKAEQGGLEMTFGGGEFLAEFYAVFAYKMRDHGTPVYSPEFFRQILEAFPGDIEIGVVRRNGKTIAAAFLNSYRGVVEAQWSASLSESLALKPNMFMFWKIMSRAAERGYRELDFGRSWTGTGSFDFKMQWGGRVVPLHWDTWRPGSDRGNHSDAVNRKNPKFQILIRAWQKLPLPVTTLMGPRIARYLPS